MEQSICNFELNSKLSLKLDFKSNSMLKVLAQLKPSQICCPCLSFTGAESVCVGGLQATGAARRVTVKPSSNECFEMADVRRKRKEFSRKNIDCWLLNDSAFCGFCCSKRGDV